MPPPTAAGCCIPPRRRQAAPLKLQAPPPPTPMATETATPPPLATPTLPLPSSPSEDASQHASEGSETPSGVPAAEEASEFTPAADRAGQDLEDGPKLTYGTCIVLAIAAQDASSRFSRKDGPGGRGLTTKQIYAFLLRHAEDIAFMQRKDWKAGVRHCLSCSRAFWQPDTTTQAWAFHRKYLPRRSDRALRTLLELERSYPRIALDVRWLRAAGGDSQGQDGRKASVWWGQQGKGGAQRSANQSEGMLPLQELAQHVLRGTLPSCSPQPPDAPCALRRSPPGLAANAFSANAMAGWAAWAKRSNAKRSCPSDEEDGPGEVEVSSSSRSSVSGPMASEYAHGNPGTPFNGHGAWAAAMAPYYLAMPPPFFAPSAMFPPRFTGSTEPPPLCTSNPRTLMTFPTTYSQADCSNGSAQLLTVSPSAPGRSPMYANMGYHPMAPNAGMTHGDAQRHAQLMAAAAASAFMGGQGLPIPSPSAASGGFNPGMFAAAAAAMGMLAAGPGGRPAPAPPPQAFMGGMMPMSRPMPTPLPYAFFPSHSS